MTKVSSQSKTALFEGEGWKENQGRRGRAPRPAQQQSTFELATQNRWGPLMGNC